jgi:hypothetical protein
MKKPGAVTIYAAITDAFSSLSSSIGFHYSSNPNNELQHKFACWYPGFNISSQEIGHTSAIAA